MDDFIDYKGRFIKSAPTARAERGWGFEVHVFQAMTSPVRIHGPHFSKADYPTKEEAQRAGLAWAVARIDEGQI